MQILTNQFQKELKEHGDFQFPLLISNEKLSKYDSNSFFWHWHPEIELTLITQGQMIYEISVLHEGKELIYNGSAVLSL